ncbi:MAG: hypothetical protein V4772_16920, partial [Pseudomonadota bacterium]
MKPEHILAAPSHADPYVFYVQLLNGPPLVYDAAHKFWIASSAAAVKIVLSHPDCHVRSAAELVPAAIAGSSAGEVFGYLMRMNEGERHDKPRFVLQRFFAGLDLAGLQQKTRFIAARAAAQTALSSGAGVYIACCDQRNTSDSWYVAYEPVYRHLAQLANVSDAITTEFE